MTRTGILLVAMVGIGAGAEQPPGRSAEETAIRATVLDYVQGWYEGDAGRMERALHPELAKRVVRTDATSGKSRLDQMSAMTLVQYTRMGGGKKTPPADRQQDVQILDVFENAASARATMSGWVDYLHLAKVDGQWKIVNVLWELKPPRK